MIPRLQKSQLIDKLQSNKLILLTGPKSAGKLALIHQIVEELQLDNTTYDCSEKKVRKTISDNHNILQVNTPILILDEAQHLDNLQGIIELILSNTITATTVVCCSFIPHIDELLLEAIRLQGLEFPIFAPSFYESASHFGLPQEEKLLEERLIFGNYPQVLSDLDHAELTLRELIQEVLFTRLSSNDRINKGDKMMRVLQLLAFEIGNPVSFNEIGEKCGIDNETVERYVELLEQAFILIKLPPFHSEKRYELKKTNAIYFMDNGIRNALISNFNPTFLRNDMNQLWKNYLISERVKWIKMNGLEKNTYFWKTHTKQQMDFVEVGQQDIRAYKIDWEKRKKIKLPLLFSKYYPTATQRILNKSTYWSFLTKKN